MTLQPFSSQQPRSILPADNGPGIAPEMHQRVFELFGKSRSSSGKASSGIGLSIVKKLIEQNGGEITLESENGRGATFSFIWPR